MDGATVAEIISGVQDGSLDTAFVDASAARIAALQRRTALGVDETAFDAGEHHALARRAAAASIVLLRSNKTTLPLAQGTTVAVLGEFAEKPRYQGGGSSHVNARFPGVTIPVESLHQLIEASKEPST